MRPHHPGPSLAQRQRPAPWHCPAPHSLLEPPRPARPPRLMPHRGLCSCKQTALLPPHCQGAIFRLPGSRGGHGCCRSCFYSRYCLLQSPPPRRTGVQEQGVPPLRPLVHGAAPPPHNPNLPVTPFRGTPPQPHPAPSPCPSGGAEPPPQPAATQRGCQQLPAPLQKDPGQCQPWQLLRTALGGLG